MSIGFRVKTPEEIRAELAKVSDAQLIEHGKTLRQFCRRVPGQKIDRAWLMQLNEDRARGSGGIPRGSSGNELMNAIGSAQNYMSCNLTYRDLDS
jgi:hypothetical protein